MNAVNTIKLDNAEMLTAIKAQQQLTEATLNDLYEAKSIGTRENALLAKLENHIIFLSNLNVYDDKNGKKDAKGNVLKYYVCEWTDASTGTKYNVFMNTVNKCLRENGTDQAWGARSNEELDNATVLKLINPSIRRGPNDELLIKGSAFKPAVRTALAKAKARSNQEYMEALTDARIDAVKSLMPKYVVKGKVDEEALLHTAFVEVKFNFQIVTE